MRKNFLNSLPIFFEKFFTSKFFLPVFGSVIFLLSIYLRSLLDIGADTGIYINLGEKISRGGRYYYDFFESNFPLSFWLYALEYQASSLLHISPIIFSEIVINLLALASIFWSMAILKKSQLSQNCAYYNLVIISFFCGFFLRPHAIAIGEFGTKTSFLLVLLFPYFCYSFDQKNSFTKKDLIWRGVLMGLIPCLKPQYLILILPIEFYRFWQSQNRVKFLFSLDKLVMVLIGVFYLVWMIKFMPEFFEFIVPMVKKSYDVYDNFTIFLKNLATRFGAQILIFSFIFLSFSRLKMSGDDKVLLIFYCAASALIAIESIGTIDQIVVFYAVATTCVFKLSYDFLRCEKFFLNDNLFIIFGLLVVPFFDLGILPTGIFGMTGLINIAWLLAVALPFLLFKQSKQKIAEFFFTKKALIFFLIYVSFAYLDILILQLSKGWEFVAFNLAVIFLALLFFEKKIHAKRSQNFSPILIFAIFSTLICLIHEYAFSIYKTVKRKDDYSSPNQLFDAYAYYSKVFAPKKTDSFSVDSMLIGGRFPALIYLEKTNYLPMHLNGVASDLAPVGKYMILSNSNLDSFFVNDYFHRNFLRELQNPNVKILFVNNSPDLLNKKEKCIMGDLEHRFLDPHFRTFFLKNFRFENRLLITRKVKPLTNSALVWHGKKSENSLQIFDQVSPTTQKILYDYEVYVKHEKTQKHLQK